MSEIPYQKDFPPQEFQARWARIYESIGPDAVAVLQGAPLTDGFVMPRQYSEFYYLSGVETPHSYLLLDGRSKRTTLYLPPRNPRMEGAEGKLLSAEDAEHAVQLVGVDEVQSTAVLADDWLGKLRPKIVYTPFGPPEQNAQCRYELQLSHATIGADYWDGRLPRHVRFIELLKTRYPPLELRDLTPQLDRMRAVKSKTEVALIREASRIAGLAQMEAMRRTKPGMFEYQLDAIARYVFLLHGCRLEGYRSIVASGTANISNVHYFRNSSQMRDGDLVLMDCAPELGCYCSDITRIWPVNGKFSGRQRELLQFILEYRNAVLARIRPGLTASQIREEAAGVMTFGSRFSEPTYETAARKLVETGGGVFSHPVGMAVHDDGRYQDGPLQPGHLFSIDPQLWVPEEGLYLRYEDVVVVTEDGVENFTDFVPAELDDIEATMREEPVYTKDFEP